MKLAVVIFLFFSCFPVVFLWLLVGSFVPCIGVWLEGKGVCPLNSGRLVWFGLPMKSTLT